MSRANPQRRPGARNAAGERVITHRRRCGKANCRCASGEQLHESTVLSYSEGSKTRFVMLPEAEVEEVRQATQRFKTAKASLEARAEASLKELTTRLKRQRQKS